MFKQEGLLKMTTYTVIIGLYFALVVFIGSLTRKVASRSASDFLIAGRNMGVGVCAVVVAAEWIGGMSTIGVSEKSYTTMTLQPVLFNISTAIGMVIIGFTVASEYRRREVHTVSEMLESLFGKSTRSVSAICFLIAYIVLAYVQLQACASVIAPLFGISWEQAVIASAVVITFYTYYGGMHALAITGILYLLTMIIGIGTAFVIGIVNIGGFEALRLKLVEMGSVQTPFNPFSGDLVGAVELLVGGVLGGMAAQASIQPIFGAKDVATAKKSALIAALIVAPFGIMTGVLGLIARTGIYYPLDTLVDPKMALPRLLTTPEFIHPLLGGFALAGILAAILSTVGPVNFAVVTIAAKDIYHDMINPAADDQRIIKTARRLVILVSVLTLPLAIFLRGAVLDVAYISYAIRAIGAIVIVMGLYSRRWITPRGVNMAFIGGVIVIFGSLLVSHMKWLSINKTLGAIGAAFIFIIIANLMERVSSSGKVSEGSESPGS